MKRTKAGFGFWKFLIVMTLIFNAINFYFISGLYNVLGGGDLTPLSNTAITGQIVLGNSTLIGMILLIVIVGVYAIFRK